MVKPRKKLDSLGRSSPTGNVIFCRLYLLLRGVKMKLFFFALRSFSHSADDDVDDCNRDDDKSDKR